MLGRDSKNRGMEKIRAQILLPDEMDEDAGSKTSAAIILQAMYASYE